MEFIKGITLCKCTNNIHAAVSEFSLKQAKVSKVFDFIGIGFRRQQGGRR